MMLFPNTIDLPPDSSDFRREAAARYQALGMPTPKLESWKYTDLRPFQAQPLACTIPAIPAVLITDALRFVFMNGRLIQSPSSLPDGVKIGNIDDIEIQMFSTMTPPDQAISALNAALFSDGLAILVSKNVTLEQSIEVVFAGAGTTHLRLAIVLEENSTATIVEVHAGSAPRTIVSEIDLWDGARLQHYRLQNAEETALVLATGGISLDKNALYDSFALTTGGRLSRHQVKATLNGPGGEVRLNGAHVLSGNMHADTTTEIRHMYPNCRSRETYRHVMDGTSRSVFQGKIFVAQDAQKTDGFQLNQSLMLSPTAEVNAKPELEIYADDVKCSHGATSGRLDEEALFYLRSRGIPAETAKQMLIQAFIGSSIDLIENETVREAFHAHAASVLGEVN